MTGTLQRRPSYFSDDSEPARMHELSSHSAVKIRERAQFGCQKYCGPPLRKMIEKTRRKASSLHLIGLFTSGLRRMNLGWSETLASPLRACTEVTDAFLRPITNLNDRQPRHLALLNSMGQLWGPACGQPFVLGHHESFGSRPKDFPLVAVIAVLLPSPHSPHLALTLHPSLLTHHGFPHPQPTRDNRFFEALRHFLDIRL